MSISLRRQSDLDLGRGGGGGGGGGGAAAIAISLRGMGGWVGGEVFGFGGFSVFGGGKDERILGLNEGGSDDDRGGAVPGGRKTRRRVGLGPYS
ncbi:hypothetical protein NL676_013671 [Syzygium grande]|nr:hypothetical protein NL676_013671 [Syzygium grande]